LGQRLLGITSRSVVTRQPHASQIHQRLVTRTAMTSWLLQLARRFSVSALHVRHSNAVTWKHHLRRSSCECVIGETQSASRTGQLVSVMPKHVSHIAQCVMRLSHQRLLLCEACNDGAAAL
jgi:hypothetical protein